MAAQRGTFYKGTNSASSSFAGMFTKGGKAKTGRTSKISDAAVKRTQRAAKAKAAVRGASASRQRRDSHGRFA